MAETWGCEEGKDRKRTGLFLFARGADSLNEGCGRSEKNESGQSEWDWVVWCVCVGGGAIIYWE